jgi:GTP-binding protein
VFVDQIVIQVEAGAGGKGAVSFRREKYVPKGGPDGGNGGKGGDVILRANAQLRTLLDHRYRREYQAKGGDPGSSSRKFGKWGENCIIEVPCGTLVKNSDNEEILVDLVDNGQEHCIAHGGKGGRGNAEFATPVNQTPRFAEEGQPGEAKSLLLELKLIADVGLVGLPNAGKSTLLSVISAAKPKIAAYPFTTLEPNLGIVRYKDFSSFTVADIPGLIEGAHLGKGLGIQFLRHIERTKVLFLLIDCLSEDYANDYKVLRNEIASFSKDLAKKACFVAFSKMDAASEDTADRIKKFEKKTKVKTLSFSSISGESLDTLLNEMWSALIIP